MLRSQGYAPFLVVKFYGIPIGLVNLFARKILDFLVVNFYGLPIGLVNLFARKILDLSLYSVDFIMSFLQD